MSYIKLWLTKQQAKTGRSVKLSHTLTICFSNRLRDRHQLFVSNFQNKK